MIQDSDVFERAAYVVDKEVGGEVVLLSNKDSRLRVLNGTGADIWRLLDGATPVIQIARAVQERYGVDAAIVRVDLEDFLNDLAARELIVLKPGADARA
jgi:hypothetical protein